MDQSNSGYCIGTVKKRAKKCIFFKNGLFLYLHNGLTKYGIFHPIFLSHCWELYLFEQIFGQKWPFLSFFPFFDLYYCINFFIEIPPFITRIILILLVILYVYRLGLGFSICGIITNPHTKNDHYIRLGE